MAGANPVHAGQVPDGLFFHAYYGRWRILPLSAKRAADARRAVAILAEFLDQLMFAGRNDHRGNRSLLLGRFRVLD